MPNRVLQWSPCNSSLFASYHRKLKLFEVVSGAPDGLSGEIRTAEVIKSRKNIAKSEVTTIDWFQHESNPMLMAVGNAGGQVGIIYIIVIM